MFALDFSEPITGLAVSDLTVGGTAAGCVIGTPSGSGDEWTVALEGCGDGTVTLTLGAQRVEDLVANVGPDAAVDVLVGRRRPDRPDVGRLDRGQGDEWHERERRLHRRGRDGRRRVERPGLLLDERVAHVAAGLRLGLLVGRQRDDHVHDPGRRRDVSRLHPRDGRARDRRGRAWRGRRLDRPRHREARRVGQARQAGLEHRQRHLHDHVHRERHAASRRTISSSAGRRRDASLQGLSAGADVRDRQRRRVWQRQRDAGARGGRGGGHRGNTGPESAGRRATSSSWTRSSPPSASRPSRPGPASRSTARRSRSPSRGPAATTRVARGSRATRSSAASTAARRGRRSRAA